MNSKPALTQPVLSTGIVQNLLPVTLAVVVLILLIFAYFIEIELLNTLPLVKEKIGTKIYWTDVVVGLTIYLKTSIDFALLIGTFMKQYPGVKNRIAIEIGTAVGNALGTMAILLVWTFFKEVTILLAIMVICASLVLFKLAKSSIEHLHDEGEEPVTKTEQTIAAYLVKFLDPILAVLNPILSKIVPDLNVKAVKKLSFMGLVMTSFTVPFILGLDDFAGYVPLFNVVNVFGFGIGVFLGHCILNVLLFLNPTLTTKIIKNPLVAILGCIAFILLACYGLFEGGKLILETIAHTAH